MKSILLSLKIALVLMILVASVNPAHAQKPGLKADDELYKEIAHMDSVVFNAFNTRNIELFKTLFSEDLEFFHDTGGLTGYAHTIGFLESTAKNENQLTRELVPGSLEVYPVPGYGAMEIGEHRFCHLENGKQDCGTFKFVQIWQKKDGQWKITRVVSYGH